MPDPLPPTTDQLKAEIADLKKQLADKDELSKKEQKALESRLEKLEAALAKKEEPPPAATKETEEPKTTNDRRGWPW